MLSFCTTLLDTDVWWKELLHLSSVCECTYCSFPSRIIFCDVWVCVCSCVCTCIRSGLPVLGRRRWASLWMCSGSPAPISRNPWLCLATGAGSLWTQKAACSSGRWGKKEYGFKTWRLSTPHACGSGELTKNKPTTIFKKKKTSSILWPALPLRVVF